MHYYAKLVLGSNYKVKGVAFERGVEIAVPEELAKYLETVVEPRLLSEGSKFVVKNIPRFAVRTEDFTTEEKVAVEIADAPDTLKPSKPGRKPAA